MWNGEVETKMNEKHRTYMSQRIDGIDVDYEEPKDPCENLGKCISLHGEYTLCGKEMDKERCGWM